MASDSESSGNEEPQIITITSRSVTTSHNVAVIIHPRFLVAVPNQFQCDPMSRADKLAARLLEATTPTQMKAAAETATGTGDFMYLVFCILVVIGFIGCAVTRALERQYYALFWLQPFFALVVCFLLWSARSLWKSQHVVLTKETGTLHSRRNSFVRPVAIPVSSIRFFRKTASFTPSFSKSYIKYGVEAVTTDGEFLFGFGKSEHVAAQLEDVLNQYLRSLQDVPPPPSMLGNVDSSAASVSISKQDIPVGQDYPAETNMCLRQEESSISFTLRRKWLLEAMHITVALFAVWFFCLQLTMWVGNATGREVLVSPSANLGTALYLLTGATLFFLFIRKDSWKLCLDPDKRNSVQRTLSGQIHVKVNDYKTLKVERSEAKVLSFFQERNKRGVERLGGKRYRVMLQKGEEHVENMGILEALSETEAMFVVARIGKAFPFLFERERQEV